MKSKPTGAGENILASQANSTRDDARGGSFLIAHQQLGTLALGTAPSNGQTVTVIVNGTSIVFTAVTGSPTNPGDVKAPGTAAGFVTNLIAALRRPDLTTSTFIALSSGNQQLINYVGWGWPGSSTNIVPYSLNKNTNGAPSPLSSFNITTTVTSGTWTASTMKLYVEDGTYYIGTTRVLFTGGSSPAFTAPSTNPRIDILIADSSGTLSITQGTENASPVAPTYPTDKVVICEVYNVVGETAIYDNENQQTNQGYIYNDVRQTLAPVYVSDISQIASSVQVLFAAPTGMIAMWSTVTAPTGWLLCDGSAVSRTTYATLFALIGTTFGSGNGSTTFNVPDMRGRVPVGVGTGTGGGSSGNGAPTGGSALTARSLADWAGEETHTLSVGEMPSHTHTVPVNTTGTGSSSSITTSTTSFNNNTSVTTSSVGSGSAHNNIQPFLALEFIIKT